jgi:hypothetical protein
VLFFLTFFPLFYAGLGAREQKDFKRAQRTDHPLGMIRVSEKILNPQGNAEGGGKGSSFKRGGKAGHRSPAKGKGFRIRRGHGHVPPLAQKFFPGFQGLAVELV